MLRKLKKAIPAVISAVLCITMIFGATASAQSVKSCRSECAKLANSSFDQNHIDLVIKYHDKEAKNTIAFGKSRAKKFLKKFTSKLLSEKSEFSIEVSDKNNILLFAQKGGKVKIVEYFESNYYRDCVGTAFFSDGKSSTELSVSNKTKIKVPDNIDPPYTVSDLTTEEFELPDDITGKYFKFKSGGKIYYYEEFTVEDVLGDEAVGFLFDENGNILAMLEDEEVCCVSFKTKVDDSEFEIPKGYKTVDINDFEY